jgi:hypothetical protein
MNFDLFVKRIFMFLRSVVFNPAASKLNKPQRTVLSSLVSRDYQHIEQIKKRRKKTLYKI